MRILILSDLHIELEAFHPPKPRPEVDLVVLAGDIHSPGRKVPGWARRDSVFGPEPEIIFVPGNHEFYGTVVEDELEAMTEECAKHRVTLLHRDIHYFQGIRFLGATLWTDFRLLGDLDVDLAMRRAGRKMNDYHRIERRADPRKRQWSSSEQLDIVRPGPIVPLTAECTLAWHWRQRSYIQYALARAVSDGTRATVVITHHAPSAMSVPKQYQFHDLSPAFASELLSDLSATAEQRPSLWVHGHIHSSADYVHESGCRVVCNPRGYNRSKDGGWENPLFDPSFVIDL